MGGGRRERGVGRGEGGGGGRLGSEQTDFLLRKKKIRLAKE